MFDQEAKNTERPKADPRALTPEYHKARKQLMLWAGILFVWELVGIDLEKAQEAGGNAGALLKSIRSPQAIPWVLLILVGYFLFRFTVEWFQSNASRRKMTVARIDFFSSLFISLLAYALYIGQAVRRVQFANLQKTSQLFSLALGIASSAIAAFMFEFFAVRLNTVRSFIKKVLLERGVKRSASPKK